MTVRQTKQGSTLSINMKLIILLLTALTLSNLSTKARSTSAVQDLDGRQLQRGVEYYILPATHGNGGGLLLASRNRTCPLAVAQEKLDVVRGLPITFSTSDSREDIVQLSKDVNIKFKAATLCAQTTVWKLGDADASTGRRYVVAGGITGSPGVGTVSSWFKIDKYGSNYKIVYCPSVCKICKVVCGNVGVFVEGGNRWLGLSDVPLLVTFKRVKVV